jgi:DNA-binding NtrC family response regulator
MRRQSESYKALLQAQFSKTRAAKLLGISRTTLWRKLQELQWQEKNRFTLLAPIPDENADSSVW